MGIKEKMRSAVEIYDPKGYGGAIVIGVLCGILALSLFEISNDLRKKNEDQYYMELTVSIYKIPDECMNKYFSDLVDDKGYLYLSEPIPEDCGETFFEDFTRIIHGNETEQDLHALSESLFQRLKEINANTAKTKTVFMKNKDGSIFHDYTEEVEKDHQQARKKKERV